MDRFKYSNAFCLFVVVISSLILYAADAEPTYTIVAPAKLRPNSDYHVSCSMHGIGDHADVDISVAGKDQGSDEFKTVTKTISLGNGETRIINFEIGAWGPGSYKLIAIGRGALQFRNETNIQFEQKSYSVFVQTDKAIYKPGQLVQFRAIVVNPSLLPSVTGAIDIYIKDAKGNRIKQWNRELTNKGIISKELQLSSQPVLGDWTIEVQILEQKFTKSFTVAEYILPTFDVEVNLPSYATYNKSNEVVSTVKATYTYGKPVKGLVTLTVQPRVRYNRLSVRPLEQFQVKQEFDGSIDIPVDVVKDLGLQTDFFEREIEFFALVEETHTGRKYNRTSILKMYDKDVKVELIKTSKTFKPGLKYTILLKVAYQDDTPVPDNGPQLSLRYGYSYNEENWTSTLTGVRAKECYHLTSFHLKMMCLSLA
ncbi:Antigen -like protein [Halotydeus destructor]|nr:Antigen -like protein [Halotydeus destructor]